MKHIHYESPHESPAGVTGKVKSDKIGKLEIVLVFFFFWHRGVPSEGSLSHFLLRSAVHCGQIYIGGFGDMNHGRSSIT